MQVMQFVKEILYILLCAVAVMICNSIKNIHFGGEKRKTFKMDKDKDFFFLNTKN